MRPTLVLALAAATLFPGCGRSAQQICETRQAVWQRCSIAVAPQIRGVSVEQCAAAIEAAPTGSFHVHADWAACVADKSCEAMVRQCNTNLLPPDLVARVVAADAAAGSEQAATVPAP